MIHKCFNISHPRRINEAWLGVLIICALSSCLGGCARRYETIVYQDSEAGYRILPADSCAIGGVVMRNGFRLDSYAGVDFTEEELTLEVQANLWGPLLDNAFRVNAGHDPAVDWGEWRNSISEESLAKILDCQARGRFVPPEILLECGEQFPQARWLFLANIYKSKLMYKSLEELKQQHASGRKIWMQLDVYDLKKGYSIWTSRVKYEGEGSKMPPNPTEARVLGNKLQSEGRLPDTVITRVLSGPPLRPIFNEGLIVLLNPVVYGLRVRP